jgi:hypothetical protein
MKIAQTNARGLKRAISICGVALLGILPACLRVHVDPVEVKPITLNINVKYVDDKLDDFYSFEKKYEQNAPATQPTTRAASPSDAQAINARYMQ